MTPPRLDATERRKMIVDAATPLFARHGFSGTSMKEIAQALRISEALVFKHFPTKAALYAEILRSRCETDPALEMLKALPNSTASLVQMVHHMIRHFMIGSDSAAEDTKRRLIVNSLLEDGEFARLVFEMALDKVGTKFAECVAAAEAEGALAAVPISVTNRFWLGHHVCAMLAYARLPGRATVPYSGTVDELVIQATWFVLRGIGVKDDVIQRYLNATAAPATTAPRDTLTEAPTP